MLDARFALTAVEPKQYPSADRPEVAFVGRSNVGKSSMINALLGRRKLVRVSNTPGRTRTINFFDAELEDEGLHRAVRLADLPGYGFAKVSKDERQRWKQMIETYLRARTSLRVVVAIVDAEVGPTADDLRTIDFLADIGPRVLVAATKIDRLPKARRKPRIQAITQDLELPDGAVLGFSSTEKLGHDEMWSDLLGVLFQ